MQRLPAQGQQRVEAIAQRYGVSTDAVLTLLDALIAGHGTMAQFTHPELGGSGQWMQGGMTMVGDMWNHALKAQVDGVCAALARLLAQQPGVMHSLRRQPHSQRQSGRQTSGPEVSLVVPAASGATSPWWPAEFGMPRVPACRTISVMPIFLLPDGWPLKSKVMSPFTIRWITRFAGYHSNKVQVPHSP